MIWFLSDLHGGEHVDGLHTYRTLRKEGDLLLLLGDLELAFRPTEENQRFTEEFLALPYPIAFFDGNHDNYPFLHAYPTETWGSGTVHRLSDQIVYLRRGEIYEIDGKTFFIMGGCKSSAKWKEMGLWYPDEEPNEAEIEFARENLIKRGCRVDYVLTHRHELGDDPEARTLAGLCAWIEENVAYTHWYVGHYHKNERRGEKLTCVFDIPFALTE